MPDKRDMHKAKSKGRHRPGGQAGARPTGAGAADAAIGGADATGSAAYGGGPGAGAMPGKKNDGQR